MRLRVLCIIIVSGLFCLPAHALDLESDVKFLHQTLGWAQLLLILGGIAVVLNFIFVIVLWCHNLATSGNVTEAKKEIQESLHGLNQAIEEVHTIKTELLALRTDQLPQMLNTRTAQEQTKAVQSDLTAARTDLRDSLTAVKTELGATLQTLRSDVNLARGEAQTTLQILRTEVAALKGKGEQQGD